MLIKVFLHFYRMFSLMNKDYHI